MKSIRAYRYRIYPSHDQESRILETLETCRRLYNSALAQRIETWKERGESTSYVDQAKRLTRNKNEWQSRVHISSLQSTLMRLDRSYKAFFTARKSGRAHGFPRFKPMHRFESFAFVRDGYKVLDDLRHIRLSRIGDVPIRYHRQLPDGRIKTCQVSREVDQWFVILTVEADIDSTLAEMPDAIVGVDVGIEHFATLSTGEHIANPRYLLRAEQRLKQLQKRLSRKKKGSKNRAKSRVVVAKSHRKIKRQRNWFLHQVSHDLARKYGHIVFEKLTVSNMVRNHKLAKHIADASWNRLVNLTTEKAARAAGCVELVDARYTSQDCSGCGQRVAKSLAVRMHKCPCCGLELQRDINAAINIAGRSETGRNYVSGDRVSREGAVETAFSCGGR